MSKDLILLDIVTFPVFTKKHITHTSFYYSCIFTIFSFLLFKLSQWFRKSFDKCPTLQILSNLICYFLGLGILSILFNLFGNLPIQIVVVAIMIKVFVDGKYKERQIKNKHLRALKHIYVLLKNKNRVDSSIEDLTKSTIKDIGIFKTEKIVLIALNIANCVLTSNTDLQQNVNINGEIKPVSDYLDEHIQNTDFLNTPFFVLQELIKDLSTLPFYMYRLIGEALTMLKKIILNINN